MPWLRAPAIENKLEAPREKHLQEQWIPFAEGSYQNHLMSLAIVGLRHDAPTSLVLRELHCACAQPRSRDEMLHCCSFHGVTPQRRMDILKTVVTPA